MPIDFEYVTAQSTDALIAETLRNEVICATFTNALKAPAFATLKQIEGLERFLESFAPEERAAYVDELGALERPIQAAWHLQNDAMQRALRAALADLPVHIEGSEYLRVQIGSRRK
jgi:hypothetical protein